MTSTFTVGVAQVDGRAFIRETHTDDFGLAHVFDYLAPTGNDHAGVLALRATGLVPHLKAAEAQRLFDDLIGYSFRYNTATELAAAFRAEFLTSRARRTAELARWLLNGIDGGFFPDAGVRTAFGLSVANWNTLKTKLGVLRTKLNDIEAAAGE